MNLGQRILDLRKKAGMSQGDLAEVLNVSRQSISKWETDSSIPELDKLVKMSEVFNVSLDGLVRGNVEEEKDGFNKEGLKREAYPVQSPRVERRKILGMGLFGMGFIVLILLSLLGDVLVGTIFAAPFFITGLIHLLIEKNPGLWSFWAVYLLTYQFLIRFTSSRPIWGIFQPGMYGNTVTASILLNWGMTILLGLLIFMTYRTIKSRKSQKTEVN